MDKLVLVVALTLLSEDNPGMIDLEFLIPVTFQVGHYPGSWRRSLGAVLRKHDYLGQGLPTSTNAEHDRCSRIPQMLTSEYSIGK